MPKVNPQYAMVYVPDGNELAFESECGNLDIECKPYPVTISGHKAYQCWTTYNVSYVKLGARCPFLTS